MDTQAACWKCGARLAGGSGASAPPVARAPLGVYGTAPAASPLAATPVSYLSRSATADPAVASWSSALLGLLFPYAAIPVGLVFLMFDDKRRAEIGRLAIIWGVVGTVVHTLAAFLFMRAAVAQLPSNMQNLIRLQQGIRAGQENRGMTEPVPNPVFPSP